MAMQTKMSIALILFLITLDISYGQSTTKKDVLFFELGGGATGNGTLFYVSQLSQLSNALYTKASLFYESGTGVGIKYKSFGADIVSAYRIIKIGESFFINVKGGVTLNADKLTTPLAEKDAAGKTIQNDHSLFKVGVLGGGEAQWKFSKKLSLIVGGDQRYLFGSDTWGHVRWLGYGGLRYTIK